MMNATTRQHKWTSFLQFFNDQNRGRRTRLGVFEPNSGAPADYWLECGLPFVGIDLDTHTDMPTMQIMVGSLTHEVKNAIKINWQLTSSGDEDGLDVLGGDGRLTVFRFEAGPK